MKSLPPKWAERLLKWYCHHDLLEEIQGDAYELFYRRVDEEGIRSARRKFAWDVIRFFRWSNVKKSTKVRNNTLTMINSYVKFGIRNLSKNLMISSINIFGLAVAVGVSITTYIFVDHQFNMETLHSKKDRIYEVLNHVTNDNGVDIWGDSPMLLGPALQADQSSIETYSRVSYQYASVRRDQNVFHERIHFVDPDFLKMFDFPMISGGKHGLDEKKNVVISKRTAEKYFGYEDPMGRTLSMKFPNGALEIFTVTGVLDKWPVNASFYFDIILPMDNYFQINQSVEYDWSKFADGLFVLFKEGHSPQELSNMDKYLSLQNASDSKFVIDQFEFLPLEQASLRSYQIKGDIPVGSHPAGRIALGITAVLLMILACFNYMNIAVAASTKRLKEIALRKVLGGQKQNIIHQFLIENLVLCVAAFALGIGLSYFLFTPGFDAIIPFEIPFAFSSFKSALLFFGGMLVVVSLISGGYPAFYISRFQPVDIFRGNEKLGRKNLFSKILLTLQLALACLAVVACFVFTDHAIYLNHKSWGYNPDGVISIVVQNSEQYRALKKEAESNPLVLEYSGAKGHIGYYDKNTTVDHLGKQIRSHTYQVSSEYTQVMGLKVLEGVLFDEVPEVESAHTTVINKIFAEQMGWENPIDYQFTYDSIDYRVIGVVDNYYLYYFNEAVAPAFFTIGDESNFDRFVFRVDPDKLFEVDEQFAEAWFKIAPNDPYVRDFQEDTFDDFYRENDANVAIVMVVTTLSVLLGCLGLFGILTFNINRRIKEFGVRKVLGAGTRTIIQLANKEYFGIVLIAFCLGAPIGTYLIHILLQAIYADPRPIGPFPIIISVFIMLFTIAVTVTGQVLRATRINPAEVLRKE